MMIFKACAVGIICSVCALLLRELGWRAAPIFISVASLCLICFVLPDLKDLTGGVLSTLASVGASDVAQAVLKIMGIGYLSGITADVCRDIGAERIAGAVVFVGRVEIALVAVPYVMQMLKLGLELIK